MVKTKELTAEEQKYLTDLYENTDNFTAFSAPHLIWKKVKSDGKYNISKGKITKFMQNKDSYSLRRPARHKFKRRERSCKFRSGY